MKNENDYTDDETGFSSKLTYLLIGGCIGAVLALLLAPKSGQELRESIADATRKGIERVREESFIDDYFHISAEVIKFRVMFGIRHRLRLGP